MLARGHTRAQRGVDLDPDGRGGIPKLPLAVPKNGKQGKLRVENVF